MRETKKIISYWAGANHFQLPFRDSNSTFFLEEKHFLSLGFHEECCFLSTPPFRPLFSVFSHPPLGRWSGPVCWAGGRCGESTKYAEHSGTFALSLGSAPSFFREQLRSCIPPSAVLSWQPGIQWGKKPSYPGASARWSTGRPPQPYPLA